MAILDTSTPNPDFVTLIDGVLNFIVGNNNNIINTTHISGLLNMLANTCQLNQPDIPVWMTQISGTGGGIGGVVKTRQEVIHEVLKIDEINEGLSRYYRME